MELSLFLAKFLGIYMLIIAFIWIVRKKQFEDAVHDIVLSGGLLALTGGIHLLVGLMIAIAHPIWEFNWRGLITFLAYLAIVQGIFRLAFPLEAKRFILKSIKKGRWIWIATLLLFGGILTYHGFMIT